MLPKWIFTISKELYVIATLHKTLAAEFCKKINCKSMCIIT